MKNLFLAFLFIAGFLNNSSAAVVSNPDTKTFPSAVISNNETTPIEQKQLESTDAKPKKENTFVQKIKSKILEIPAIKKRFPDGGKSFYIGAFALGFLLGLLGVLIVFLVNMNSSERATKMKSAWIGCGVIAILALIGRLGAK